MKLSGVRQTLHMDGWHRPGRTRAVPEAPRVSWVTLDSEPPLPKPGSRLENQSENIANDRADLQPRGEMKL